MSGRTANGGYIHATVVLVGEAGVLIRGASGSGKSALALALMSEAGRRGLFARLVGDDRVEIAQSGGRLTARGHPAVAGLIEERGTGLLSLPHETAAVVRCIVDLPAKSHDASPPRLPDAPDGRMEVGGVELPRLALSRSLGPEESARRILALLSREAP